MTREKLIELAREAGWDYANDSSGYDPLWKFGELVAAAERNRTWTQDHWTEYERSIVATEREACAQVCLMPVDEVQITDDCSEYVYKDHLDCAEAIRARTLHDMNKAAEKNGEEL